MACPKCGSGHLPEAPCNRDADADGQVDGVFPADEPGDRDDRARLLMALEDRADEKLVPARYWPFLRYAARDFAREFGLALAVPDADPRTVRLKAPERELLDAVAITQRGRGWMAFAGEAPTLNQVAHEFGHLCGMDEDWAKTFSLYVLGER